MFPFVGSIKPTQMNDEKKVDHLSEVAELYRPIGVPVKTPLKEFDEAMDGGVRGGELVTLSGTSGTGKTSYALWLTKVLNQTGIPVLWFTFEMNPWYLKEKLIKMGGDPAVNIFVPIEHNGNSVEWILERIKESQALYACKVVFIDHLHYLIPFSQQQNTSLIIGGVARELKTLAVQTDTIVFLIAHMRRLGVGEQVRVDAIRDSALIANESDYVYLVERLEKKQSDGKALDEIYQMDYGELYTDFSRITLAKNRRTGSVFYRILKFDGQDFIRLNNDELETIKDKAKL